MLLNAYLFPKDVCIDKLQTGTVAIFALRKLDYVSFTMFRTVVEQTLQLHFNKPLYRNSALVVNNAQKVRTGSKLAYPYRVFVAGSDIDIVAGIN